MQFGTHPGEMTITHTDHARTPRRAMSAALALATTALVAAAAFCGFAPPAQSQTPPKMLTRPDSLAALIARAERERKPVVALFSQAGCPYCEAIRREQLVHLAAEQQKRGVIVVEFDIADGQPFVSKPNASTAAAPSGAAAQRAAAPDDPAWLAAGAPAALANAFGIRLAPTVVFLGARGELAERLVGYASRDFYSAYLDDRIDTARAAISAR